MRAVVVGGGPAGLAFAIEARGFGAEVIVIDRGRTVPVAGETMPAVARYALQRLHPGDDPFGGHAALAGRRARWGTPELRESSAVFNPHGCDRLIDRELLERSLRLRAVCVGTQLSDDHVVRVDRDGDGWTVALASGQSLPADFLVDATGRAMWLSRRVHGEPHVVDGLVAQSLFAERQPAPAMFEIESTPYGWWYRAPLPDGRDVLMLLTDNDLLPADIEGAARATHLGRAAGALTRGPLRPARSMFAGAVSGEGWATVGDASLAWDPLAGAGLLAALDSAHDLAAALAASREDDGALLAYGRAHNAAVQRYDEARARAYGAERRWPAAPFWRRRHAPTERSTAPPEARARSVRDRSLEAPM